MYYAATGARADRKLPFCVVGQAILQIPRNIGRTRWMVTHPSRPGRSNRVELREGRELEPQETGSRQQGCSQERAAGCVTHCDVCDDCGPDEQIHGPRQRNVSRPQTVDGQNAWRRSRDRGQQPEKDDRKHQRESGVLRACEASSHQNERCRQQGNQVSRQLVYRGREKNEPKYDHRCEHSAAWIAQCLFRKSD